MSGVVIASRAGVPPGPPDGSGTPHGGMLLRAVGSIRSSTRIGMGVRPGGLAADQETDTVLDSTFDLLPAPPAPTPSPRGGPPAAVAPVLPFGVEVPWEFSALPLPGKALAETYHGVYMVVRYSVRAVLFAPRAAAAPGTSPASSSAAPATAAAEAEVEFFVQVPTTPPPPPPGLGLASAEAPLDFEIRPDSLENVKKSSLGAIPSFLIRGRLDRVVCSLSSPFTGHVTVEHAASRLKSIDLQLVRIETVDSGDGSGTAREATEIQTLQVGDGDVQRGQPVPLYMIFPRVFTCPTTATPTCRVEFEVNVLAVFEDGYTVTENVPLVLYREAKKKAVKGGGGGGGSAAAALAAAL